MPADCIYTVSIESPAFFKKLGFLLTGSTGCSAGYCLDGYADKRVKEINSQVNEQANSGLQKIRGQLAYMSIDNFKLHCALFLALKNMDK